MKSLYALAFFIVALAISVAATPLGEMTLGELAAQTPASPRSVLKAAEPPTPTLVLPRDIKGDVGQFIKVTATTNGTSVRWFAVSSGLNVFPGELLKDSRVTVVTATTPGSYKLMAYTALGDQPSEPVTTVIVVGGVPIPVPSPDDNPAPPPPGPNTLPDGKYKFAKLAYDEAIKIPVPARSKAAVLGANYQDMSNSFSAAIAAGATPSIPEGLATLKERNRVSLGSDITAWGNWGVAWAQKANGHNADGSLRSASDYAAAWGETAKGLQAIK